jgi:hypothetical protein
MEFLLCISASLSPLNGIDIIISSLNGVTPQHQLLLSSMATKNDRGNDDGNAAATTTTIR